MLRYAQALSADFLSSTKLFCDSVAYCAETDSDSISGVLLVEVRRLRDLDDLDDTQFAEPCRKRWKEDNVAKEMLMRCAEDAAGRATAKVEDITSRLMQDAADRDRRLAERDQKMMEQLTGLLKGVSDTMDGRMSDLEQRVQHQWTVFEKKVGGKMVQLDDKEAEVTQAEHRIKLAVQRDADERLGNRMDKEDRITASTFEVLRSEVTRLSAKLSEEVVCMKSRYHGSAASTVSGSTGSGGSTETKTRIKPDDLNVFD